LRRAGSQAGWALISGGVNAARVDVHRLHQIVGKVLRLVEQSKDREHIYQVAGDVILGIPQILDRLEQQLDETGYALSIMGKDHLKDRLPLSRRTRVDETVEGAPAFSVSMLKDSARRVAERHIARRVDRRGRS
jgi:hypothetical protein